ncbi:unnamed protein product [Rotaria socialis]|uniref:NHL repeat containing protein n=1 Tax=Rotaria socialis TaxID=392032 RepID=A0A818UBW4_9BILA|nr:unnamed protein product [Rotaria socialis]
MIATIILSYFNSCNVFNAGALFHTLSIQIACNPFSLSIVRVKSQACDGMSQYDRCSLNSACACFQFPGASNTGICTDRYAVTCSELTPCTRSTNNCSQSDHICVHHPQCGDIPVCYPVPNYNKQFSQPIPTTTTTKLPTKQLLNIPANATWTQNGMTIAGGHGLGDATNQLNGPHSLFVGDDQTVFTADWGDHRIMQWKKGDTTNGQVVAGNGRAVRWSRRSGTIQGEILIDNIACWGLALNEQRYLYVSDYGKHEVRRYQLGEKNGTLVAGGNGKGDGVNQLNLPRYLFVDQQQNVYVSDFDNNRVVKWNKGEKEGIVIAGGQGKGGALTQLSSPLGLFIDTLGTLYVADEGNHRVMRWTQGDNKQGTVIVGGNSQGAGANQFNYPRGLSFDRHGNLYVADLHNHRAQRFSIE